MVIKKSEYHVFQEDFLNPIQGPLIGVVFPPICPIPHGPFPLPWGSIPPFGYPLLISPPFLLTNGCSGPKATVKSPVGTRDLRPL